MAWIDFLVCLFFGYLGVHKFREKKFAMGLLYLFTLGLFGFGWLYDCGKYLVRAIKSRKQGAATGDPKPRAGAVRKLWPIAAVILAALMLVPAPTPDAAMATEQEMTLPVDETGETQHEHDYLPATCMEPRKCSVCAQTDGAPAGHSWEDATCEVPKTCAVCGVTDGEPAEHSWQDATCSAPKTCAVCEATEGEPAEHSWEDATCEAPKTCGQCGETEGAPASHAYVSGSCSLCGGSDPDYVSEAMVWIPTNGGTKYHTHSGCSNMKDPRKVTISEAKALGFTPCKKCY